MAKVFGRRLTAQGFAFVTVQYRLNGVLSDLAPDVSARVDDYQSHQANLIPSALCGAASLVALEDGVRFLSWAQDNAKRYGWSDKLILGGSSAGAIMAYNLVFGAKQLGLQVPHVHGVYASTGGCNYPEFVKPLPEFRSLALHNPIEKRMPVDGIRMIKEKLGDQMELLESDQHWHGKEVLSPHERVGVAFRRIVNFAKQATA